MSARHEPVLLRETLAFLRNGAGLYLDATLGDAGHASALLEHEPGARLLGCDRDPEALAFARRRLEPFGGRVTLARACFRDLPAVHARAGAEPLTGVLLDLGLSSRQLEPERGMSFQHDGPLDLRMDRTGGEPASARLAEVAPEVLAAVLRAHGDLPRSGALARAIVAAAREGRLATTRQLAALVARASGGHAHPRRLAQVFQAIRIWINGEAEDLDAVLAWLPAAVGPDGVVVTLAYHSGEDRRVKRAFDARITRGPRRLPDAPQAAGPGSWESLTRRVVTPSTEEIASNPRARSARLRAYRRRLS